MPLTTIMIGKALATVTENEILTSGMINAKIKFEFSGDWYPALSKTAIFTAGDVTKVVLDTYWTDNVCSIPQECLAKSDEILMVGIYGADNANVVAIPTVWATVGKIRKGYEGYEDVSTGTLPIWAQVQSAAAQSATAAKNAQDAAETAQGKAEDAQEAAEAAQGKAEDAQEAAETAQSKAETAQSKAETAQGKAEAAQSKAESAASSAAGSAASAASSASAAALSEDAQEAAEAAQGKAEDAQEAAETAQSKAETAQSKAETAQGKAEAAQSKAESAASSAAGSAASAASSASAAALSEDAAAEYEAGAKTAAASAEANGKLSESWAVGGTGTRTGEDTNNAKYWAMAAQGATSGGVTSFNGRSGIVEPAAGDYTAAMVGADASGAAATVQSNLGTHTADTTKHITSAERTTWNAKANASDLTSHTGNTTVHITAAERTAWNAKQAALTFDTTPTSNSTNPVTSGGVKAAIDERAPILGTSAPNSQTAGAEGQLYLNRNDMDVYVCTRVIASFPAYYWTKVITGRDVDDEVDTPSLRNEYFVDAETTPTVEGQIAWLYG